MMPWMYIRLRVLTKCLEKINIFVFDKFNVFSILKYNLFLCRYIQVLMVGIEARKTNDQEKLQTYFYQQNDVCMLRLFEAFLESAPQLTLQLYIIVATKDAGWLTSKKLNFSVQTIPATCCIFFKLSRGWCIVSFYVLLVSRLIF